MSVAIFTPTSYRSQNIERLINSIRETSEVTAYFIHPSDDGDSWKELNKQFQPHTKNLFWWHDNPEGDTRFVKRIQSMYEQTDEEWFLTGADDVVFHPGWLEEARPYMHTHSVISFDDMCNPNVPGTNFLIRRSYIEEQSGVIDSPNTVFCQDYFHNFCDNELVETASKRREFVKCDGKIEHYHHTIGKAENDKIYQLAQSRWNEDAETFHQRRHLWL